MRVMLTKVITMAVVLFAPIAGCGDVSAPLSMPMMGNLAAGTEKPFTVADMDKHLPEEDASDAETSELSQIGGYSVSTGIDEEGILDIEKDDQGLQEQSVDLSQFEVVQGTQSRVISRRVDDSRVFKFYVAKVIHRVSREQGVVVSIWRSNRPWWLRRVLMTSDLNELWPSSTEGGVLRGVVLRSFVGDIVDAFEDVWDDASDLWDKAKDFADGLKGAARAFAAVLRDVGEFFTTFGGLLMDTADTIEQNFRNAPGYYAEGVRQVRGDPNLPIQLKFLEAIKRAIALDTTRTTGRVLAQAILNAP